MNFKRDSICIGLVGCMLLLSINDVAAYPNPATPSNLSSVKQQVEQIGVGARVKLTLAGGEKVRGNIQAMDHQGFVLDSERASHRRINYNQVVQVKLASFVYRATGAPDPIAAGRVVRALGAGHQIVVKTTGGKEYHGNIQVIGEEGFDIVPDHQTASVPIAYTQVHYVEQNLSKRAKIAIVVGVVVAVAVVLAVICSRVTGQ